MSQSNLKASSTEALKRKAPSTVGRGKVVNLQTKLNFSEWSDEHVSLFLGDSLQHYKTGSSLPSSFQTERMVFLALKEIRPITLICPIGISLILKHGQMQPCPAPRSGSGTQKLAGLLFIQF